MRSSRLVPVALLGFGLPFAAHAGAFYIPQQSTSSLGRAFAGDAALGGDASTIYANPAGMTELKGAEAYGGITVIIPTARFTNTGTTATTPGTGGLPAPVTGNDGGDPFHATPVPSLYAAIPTLDNRLWFGVGLSAPFGLTDQYNSTWFGRYESISTDLKTVDLAPSVAYRVNEWFSIGGGLDIQYAKAKLRQALPNTLAPGGPTPATDGILSLRGDDYSVGGNIGIIVKPLPTTKIGLHYRSQMSHDLGGTAAIDSLTGPLAALNGSFNVNVPLALPDIVSFGVAHQVTPKLTLLGQFQYFSWSRFEEIRVMFKDVPLPQLVREDQYDDSFGVSIGFEYDVTDALRVRSGFMFDQTPTVDSFRDTAVPDGNRYWMTFGASWKVAPSWTVDFAYAHIFFEDAVVNVARSFYDGTPAAGSVTTRGQTGVSVDNVAIAVKLAF